MAVTDRIGRMLLLTRLYNPFEEAEEAGGTEVAGEVGVAGVAREADMQEKLV